MVTVEVDLSDIDTEEKAYLLGILGADGCIKQSGKYYSLAFGLTYKDRKHVRRVADIISKGINVHDQYYSSNRNPMTYFYIMNKDLCDNLIKHGVVPRKSKTLRPPSKLPPEFIHHYVRGYFDGDGSIFYSNESRICCNCVGTEWVLDYINYNFKAFYKNKTNVTQSGQGSLYHLKFSGKSAIAFMNWIYKDATILLDRKYKIASNYLVNKNFYGYIGGLSDMDIWSEENNKFLIDNYGKNTIKSIALRLNKSQKAVSEKAHRLGLNTSLVDLSDKELQYLKENYTKKTRKEVAFKLGISLRSMLNKIRRMKSNGEW
jgi:hypothetical protein